jgi:sec-independent protein translocase protein TatC
LLLAFGLIFETPVFFFFLSKIGLVNYRMLLKFQKYAIVLAFFLGAILTPGPDVFSQFLMAIPLLILYEASIFITWLFGKKENK